MANSSYNRVGPFKGLVLFFLFFTLIDVSEGQSLIEGRPFGTFNYSRVEFRDTTMSAFERRHTENFFDSFCKGKKSVEFQTDTVIFYNPHPNSDIVDKSITTWSDGLCIESSDSENTDPSKGNDCVEWITESEILIHRDGSVQYWFFSAEGE